MSEKKKRYELSIRASIRDTYESGYLNIDETVEIDAKNFLEIAAILGKFHELAQKLSGEV